MSFFFFFKQRTAYEMRISDWSSDVCSSDLALRPAQEFDALDVVEIGIEDRRIAVGGDRQFVDIDGDRALEAGTIAVGVDAARRETVAILRRPVDDDTRRVLRTPLLADHAEVIVLFLPDTGAAKWHTSPPPGAA